MFPPVRSLLPSIISVRVRHVTASRIRTMSTTAKPDLKSWIQDRLKALYTAPDDDAFHSAFDSAFASEGRASVLINGEEISREKLKEDIRAQRAAMTKVDVTFGELNGDQGAANVVGGEEGPQSGVVKGEWTVTRSLRFKLRGAPDQMRRISQFEAMVEPVSPGSNDFRIVHLAETVETKRPPIQLRPAVHQQSAQTQETKHRPDNVESEHQS